MTVVGETIGQVLSFGIAVTLNPVTIIAVVLVLDSPRAKASGPLLLIGWTLGLFAVAGLVAILSTGAGAGDGGEPSTAVSYARLLFGLLLLVIAKRQFGKRPAPGEEAEMPRWMKAVDDIGPFRAFGTGIVLAVANPKNLILVAGAGAAVAATGSAPGDQLAALLVFAVIGTIGPAVPVGIYFFMQDRSEILLARLSQWMTRQSSTIIGVLCLIIGALLIGEGISGL